MMEQVGEKYQDQLINEGGNMALKNTASGEYHKIEYEEDHNMLEDDRVMVEVYEDTDHRTAGDTDFQKSYKKHVLFVDKTIKGILCEYTNDVGKTETDNYKTAVYGHIKALDVYDGFEDC